jgi:hypothetical protein
VAKRSPIRGYNHNVRHRGLIFHVQTEDSGVQNPHLFTHLFHGGVIISSRKLLYDNGSSEEAIKALMQSQHKAVLKDLKAGTFDEKINRYLAGTPGLEPAPERRQARDTLLTPPPEVPDQAGELESDQVTPPAGSSLSEAVLKRAVPHDTDPPRLGPTPRPGASTPPPQATGRRSEVSGAFQAIVAPDDAVPVELADDAAETTIPRRRIPEEATPEPRRKETPSGAYSQHRSGRSDFIPEVHDQPTAPIPATRRGRAATGEHDRPAATSRSGPGIVPAPPVRPAVKPQVSTGAPPRAMGKSMPASGASAAAGAPQQPRPAVVVSRPAVIIGGPPKVVGAREPADDPRRTGRRAREEPARPNLFGKDLISEKSLDEVILAYLSEDSSEE